jgi:hypothetical protein
VEPFEKATDPVVNADVSPVPPFATGSAVPLSEIARVPLVVIGLPAILRKAGTEAATLVTVPEPPPERVVHVVPLQPSKVPAL